MNPVIEEQLQQEIMADWRKDLVSVAAPFQLVRFGPTRWVLEQGGLQLQCCAHARYYARVLTGRCGFSRSSSAHRHSAKAFATAPAICVRRLKPSPDVVPLADIVHPTTPRS